MSDIEKRNVRFHWRRRGFQGVILGCALLFAMSMMGSRPENLGITAGKLAPCPTSPNCVSTHADNDSQRMESLSFSGQSETAMVDLVKIVSAMPRAQIISQTDEYLYVEFRSFLFRFVDDVEFLLNAKNRTVDFRSASRVGYSDLGANRKRMTIISKRFQQ